MNSLKLNVDRFAGQITPLPNSALGLHWEWHSCKTEGIRVAIFRVIEEAEIRRVTEAAAHES
jgi:hypothetical protein